MKAQTSAFNVLLVVGFDVVRGDGSSQSEPPDAGAAGTTREMIPSMTPADFMDEIVIPTDRRPDGAKPLGRG